jgi:hypothetical protein
MTIAPIVSFDTRWPGRTLVEHAARHPSSIGDMTLPASGVTLDASLEAEVRGGRWVARCPVEGCNGAEYVNLEAPAFFCCECRNAAFDHHPIPVKVPPLRVRSEIERYLGARPAPATRNWLPGETVRDLRRENREHGVRLKDGS